MPQWWGLKGFTTLMDKMDVKPGGIWRFTQHDNDGNIFSFHGVFHSIEPIEWLVYTIEFEGMPGHVLLDSITFVEQNGKTKLTEQSVFKAVGDRDGMPASGMEKGSA